MCHPSASRRPKFDAVWSGGAELYTLRAEYVMLGGNAWFRSGAVVDELWYPWTDDRSPLRMTRTTLVGRGCAS